MIDVPCLPGSAATLPGVYHPLSPPYGQLALRPFFTPALLHYEQQLALDYQRQMMQEHFQAQAQMLRQMRLEPGIIPSEDGSTDRTPSNSSNESSRCCSPELQITDPDGSALSPILSATAAVSASGCDKNYHRKCDIRREDDCCRMTTTTATAEFEKESGVQKSTNANNETPLNALFQLSTRNFDEDNGK